MEKIVLQSSALLFPYFNELLSKVVEYGPLKMICAVLQII